MDTNELRKITMMAFHASVWKNIPEDNMLKKLHRAAKERSDEESLKIIHNMVSNCCERGYTEFFQFATKTKFNQ